MLRMASLTDRIRAVRIEIYGEDGIEDLAEILRIPPQTWRNYERGVTMPAVVMLKFLAVTGTDPHWMLTGDGDRLTIRWSPDLSSDERYR
jgi:transcriptional regulator with XRE-family HTH domain